MGGGGVILGHSSPWNCGGGFLEAQCYMYIHVHVAGDMECSKGWFFDQVWVSKVPLPLMWNVRYTLISTPISLMWNVRNALISSPSL